MQPESRSGSPPLPEQFTEAKYEEAFEQTGHGRFNNLATLCCSLIFVHSIIEMVAIDYVITPAECDLRLTVAQKSAINSAVFVGILLTAIFWGLLADLYGRRRIMLPAVLSSVVTSFISSLCTGFWPMLIMRFLTGIMVSGSSAIVMVYLAELQNAANRDRHLTIVIAAVQLSFSLVTCVAWLILPGTWALKIGNFSINPWRVFMWLWGVVGSSGACILIFMPESPRYTVAKIGPQRAIPILAKIYAINHHTTADQFPVKSIDVTGISPHQLNLKNDLLQLVKAPIRRCVYLTHGGMFMAFFFSNGLYIWLPDVLNAVLSRYKEPISMCDFISQIYAGKADDMFESIHQPFDLVVNSLTTGVAPYGEGNSDPAEDCVKGEINTMLYPLTLAMEIFFLFPFLSVVFFINSFKKNWFYAITMWCSSTGIALTSVVPQMIAAFCFLVVGCGCGGCCGILTAMAVDAFPTNLRGLATCTMYMVGQLGAIVGTSIIGFMSNWTCHLIFGISACACAGSAVALILFWPDTDEVRRIMEHKGFTY